MDIKAVKERVSRRSVVEVCQELSCMVEESEKFQKMAITKDGPYRLVYSFWGCTAAAKEEVDVQLTKLLKSGIPHHHSKDTTISLQQNVKFGRKKNERTRQETAKEKDLDLREGHYESDNPFSVIALHGMAKIALGAETPFCIHVPLLQTKSY